MLNSKTVTIVIAGLLAGAGVANAAGTAFPSSANEVSPSLYADSLPHATRADVAGAAHPVFPTAAIEHGSARHATIEVQRLDRTPSVAGSVAPAFPVSAIEVL